LTVHLTSDWTSDFVLTDFITFYSYFICYFCFILVYLFHSLFTFICTCPLPFILGVLTPWIYTSRYGYFIYLIRFWWDRACCEEPWVLSIWFLVFLLSFSCFYSIFCLSDLAFISFLISSEIMFRLYMYYCSVVDSSWWLYNLFRLL